MMPKTARALLIPALFGLMVIAFFAGTYFNAYTSPTQRPTTRAEARVANRAINGGNRERAGAPIPVVIASDDLGCDPPDDVRTSDLCAQWKAADAAKSGSEWSKWSVILTAISLFGLGLTVYFTMTSAHSAEASAKAARDTLHAGRAWVTVQQIDDGPVTTTWVNRLFIMNGFAFRPKIKNFGQSPALNARLLIEKKYLHIDDNRIDFPDTPTLLDMGIVIPPGQELPAAMAILSDIEASVFLNRRMKVLLSVFIFYDDTFSAAGSISGHQTTQHYLISYGGGVTNQSGVPRSMMNVQPVGKTIVT